MKTWSFFSDSEVKKIQEAVTTAERGTTGEIVPVVVRSSGGYGWLYGCAGILGWLTSVGVIFFLKRAWVEILDWELLAIQVGLIGVFSFLPSWDFLVRWVVPERWQAAAVHKNGLALFLEHGLHHTRGETGILILISALERRVEILADRGIHNQVGSRYWDDQVQVIVRGLRAGQAANALVDAIGEMGRRLAELFPSKHENPDEIDNHVVQRES